MSCENILGQFSENISGKHKYHKIHGRDQKNSLSSSTHAKYVDINSIITLQKFI